MLCRSPSKHKCTHNPNTSSHTHIMTIMTLVCALYTFFSGTDMANFEINEDTGDIETINCIDRDTDYVDGSAVFTVIAENVDQNPLQVGVANVTVYIEDVNDNDPNFEGDPYDVSLEILVPEQRILTVTAIDIDQVGNTQPLGPLAPELLTFPLIGLFMTSL